MNIQRWRVAQRRWNYRWQRLSFRQRLTLGITGLHFVLMSLLVLDLLYRQHVFLHHQGEEHAGSLARTLAVSSASWLMANDVVGLQEVTASVANNRNVRYVMILNPELRVLSHSDPRQVGLFVTDSQSAALLDSPPMTVPVVRSHDLEDIAAPVMAGHKHIGWARVGIGQEAIGENLSASFLRSMLYLLMGSLIAYVFARLVAHWLIVGLGRITSGFERVSAGQRGMRIKLERKDEMGTLARGFNRMMDDLEAKENELQTLATTDFLTGLPNRRCFLERLQAEQARLKRSGKNQTALLMLDLDHFKRVNDTYGHIAGDAVLRQLSGLIRNNLREQDSAGRFGGEEFVMLLVDTDVEGALQMAERLRKDVENQQTPWEGGHISLTVSIGLTLLRADDASAEQAIARADSALYKAKESGRNRVMVDA